MKVREIHPQTKIHRQSSRYLHGYRFICRHCWKTCATMETWLRDTEISEVTRAVLSRTLSRNRWELRVSKTTRVISINKQKLPQLLSRNMMPYLDTRIRKIWNKLMHKNRVILSSLYLLSIYSSSGYKSPQGLS